MTKIFRYAPFEVNGTLKEKNFILTTHLKKWRENSNGVIYRNNDLIAMGNKRRNLLEIVSLAEFYHYGNEPSREPVINITIDLDKFGINLDDLDLSQVAAFFNGSTAKRIGYFSGWS
jgi:hypothetical protein